MFQSTAPSVLCSTCCSRWHRRLNTSFTCSSAHRKGAKKKERKKKEKRERKTRHNRKQEEERDLADPAEARCRVWLRSTPPTHTHTRSHFSQGWLQEGGRLAGMVAGLFSSPGVFSKPLGLVCAPVAASWWVAVVN